SGNAIDCRRILSQGLSEGRTRRGALRRAERVQGDRHTGSGRRRQNGTRGWLELLRRRRDHNLLLGSEGECSFTLCFLWLVAMRVGKSSSEFDDSNRSFLSLSCCFAPARFASSSPYANRA